jgi:hypothetical protein
MAYLLQIRLAMSVVHYAAQLTAPWAHLYSGSKLVSTSVLFGHLGGLLLGGGFAIAADRTTLRMVRASAAARQIHLHELQAVHRPVIIGLAVTFVSGLLMLAADVETFLPAPLFWFKMGLIAALLANGLMLERSERALRSGTASPHRIWRRLEISARTSLCLWFGSLLLGTALLAA